MDLATIVGLVGGFGLLVVIMVLAGSLMMFWDFLSLVIVLGGAAFATLMRWPLSGFIGGMGAGLKAVMNSVDDPRDLIKEIIELANIARKESILALEKVEPKNRFLAKAVRFMVDGYAVEVIVDILDVDISGVEQRHKDGRGVFENMGEACPAFGMIGTVIGLIVIMANLSDPNAIGPGLAVALVTTLYGSLIANMVFIPLAAKLKFRSNQELTNMDIIKEGVVAILNGENPRAIEEKLESFLGPNKASGGDAE